VCDDVGRAAVTGQQGRRHEGQARVLHAAFAEGRSDCGTAVQLQAAQQPRTVGEGRRKHQQVVLPPHVGTCERLSCAGCGSAAASRVLTPAAECRGTRGT